MIGQRAVAVAVLAFASSVSAQPPQVSALAVFAPAQEALDFAGLGRFFDAARLRMQSAFAPRAAARLADQRLRPGGAWGRQTLIVPDPVANSAYRRTFRILMSHLEATDRYDELILKCSSAYSVDARLLKAIIAAESEFFAGAVSPRGARGLMQVMPATASELGFPANTLSVPEYNIAAGAAYIARLIQAAWRVYRLKGVAFQDAPDWLRQRVIAAYNAGPRFLFRHQFLPETKLYVRKVLLFYDSRVADLRRPKRGTRR